MSSPVESILAFVVAIGLLVAVHEYGHYAVARALGVKVLRYSVGFGPPLWRRRGRGPDHTEYCLSAIPLGGYVKLLDERDCDVAPGEQHRAFNRQPATSRIAILAAGPAFNLVFAVLAYWVMFMAGIPGTRPVVGAVAPDTPAARAGLRPEDRVVAVAGRPVATWEGATLAMLDELLGGDGIELRVAGRDGFERDLRLDTAGRAAELTEPGRLFEGLGFDAWMPRVPPVIGDVLPGSPAGQAGLKPGDRIVRVAGEAVDDFEAVVARVRPRPGEDLVFVIRRDGVERELTIAVGRKVVDGKAVGQIGAASQAPPREELAALRTVERYGPVDALVRAAARTWEMSAFTVRMIGRMVTGDVSAKNISGPISIAQYAGASASVGVNAFLGFLAVISISLGVLNLLPVPMLDGGQIAYTLVEAAKGSPLSERSQVLGQQVGIFLLLLLMTFAFYNDISRLLG
jgi:regulator of sigma E protease